MESGLLVAKEVAVEEGAAVPAPVDPTEAKATLPATILEENPAIMEDKTTRVTAGDNSGYLHSKKPRPIAWPGLFVCCL